MPRLRRRLARGIGSLAALSLLITVLLAVSGGNPASSESSSLGPATKLAPLPSISITFAANSTAEVNSLVNTDRSYIEPGDSFDLVSGTPSTSPLAVGEINYWASLLRAAYPGAAIFASTSGIAHFATLAKKVNADISGIFYDYEPGYEAEFTVNFTQTLAEFTNVTEVAHAHGLLSIGYPTGRPISEPKFRSDHWDYGALSGVVDRLDVQTQTYCHESARSFENATSRVRDQYAAVGASGIPTFQVTLGINASLTPNQVSPSQAYNCTQVLTGDGLKTLYLWFGPGSNSDVLRFLKDIGRTPT